MKRTLLAAIVLALLPTPLFAYINAGFKSASAYRTHLRKQHAAKIGRATEAIRRDPKDAVAYLYRANIYAGMGGFTAGVSRDYERALADYDKAIELDPKLAQAYLRRGEVRLRVDRKETPEERAAYALPLAARQARLQELWDRPERRQRRAKALADLEKSSQLDAAFVEAHVVFAENTKDVAKAIEAAKRACEYTQYKGQVCLELLASLYAQKGDFDNAVRWQEKALTLEAPFGVNMAKKRLQNYRMKKTNKWAIHTYWAKYEGDAARKRRESKK